MLQCMCVCSWHLFQVEEKNIFFFSPLLLTSLHIHPTVNNNQCFISLLALENVCGNQPDNPNYFLIAFFSLFIEVIPLTERGVRQGCGSSESLCFNASGISSPGHGQVKVRSVLPWRQVRAVQEEAQVFRKGVWPYAGKANRKT